MKLKHCEARVTPSEIKFEDSQINEWKNSWPEGEISYRLNNLSDDLSKRWQIRAVTVALRVWQLRLSKIKFRRERNPDTSVDFDVSFEDLSHFDGRKGVLAHAYYPGQGKPSGDCHINDEWNWVASSRDQSLSKPPLVPILIHEFGHSLGLVHDPTSTKSIMYPSFNLGLKKFRLGPNDIRRIQERYSPRTLSQRFYDMMAFRRLHGRDFR